jgi:hypothetical protein
MRTEWGGPSASILQAPDVRVPALSGSLVRCSKTSGLARARTFFLHGGLFTSIMCSQKMNIQ